MGQTKDGIEVDIGQRQRIVLVKGIATNETIVMMIS
jgi:hypothetical protein